MKRRVPVADEKALMPIKDRTKVDAGSGFIVGLGGNKDERQVQPKRAPSTTSPRTPRKSSGKLKGK